MADQEVENGGADEKVLTEAKSTVAASDHMFVLGVGGFEVIPILGVEAPKAEDAVQFYKAAFGAVEVNREAEPRRKEDLEQPLLHVLLQFGSGKVLVVDRLEDELKAQQNSTFQLVTEGDVEAVIDKVLSAGGNIAGGSYFGSSELLVVNPLEDELKAQQLVAGDVEAVIKKNVGAGGITKGIGVDDDHAFLGKKYCGKVEDPYGVVWTLVGKNTIGGVREHVGGEVGEHGGGEVVEHGGGEVGEHGGGEVGEHDGIGEGEHGGIGEGEHGGEFGPPIHIVVVAPDKTLGDLVRRSIDVRMPGQFELTADLRNLQGLPSTMKSQVKLYQPVNVVIVDLDMVYDIRLRSGAVERRSIGELNSFYDALRLVPTWSVVGGIISPESGSKSSATRRRSNEAHFREKKNEMAWLAMIAYKPISEEDIGQILDAAVSQSKELMPSNRLIKLWCESELSPMFQADHGEVQ